MGKTIIHLSCVIAATTLALSVFVLNAPVRAQPIPADALIKARDNCLTSVGKTVGIAKGNLKVIRQTSDPSGISVDVKVPKATAPWGCLTDRQGKVEDVHFKGSEGAL